MKIGVMQGRLVPPEDGRFQSFPRERWRDEFPNAQEAGIDYIEWIVDSVEGNPIFTSNGIDEINTLKEQCGIETPAICADWFMEHPLREGVIPWKNMLFKLMARAPEIGAKRIILPFVDNSSIVTQFSEFFVVDALKWVNTSEVELHLETDLPPVRLATLLEQLPNCKANYDSGNSSGLGYVASEEFAAYGERIGSIHIKDRYRKPEGGIETRPLGQGSADFEDVFAAIHSIYYAGGLTLQVSRGADGCEIEWILQQAEFVRKHLQSYPSPQYGESLI